MAFADPQSITINAVANSLPRTSSDPAGVFTKDDGTVKLTVSHRQVKGRNQRLLRLDHSKIAPDVFTSDNIRHTFSVWLSVDAPSEGYTIAEQKQVVDGVLAALTASSGAKITQLLSNEK